MLCLYSFSHFCLFQMNKDISAYIKKMNSQRFKGINPSVWEPPDHGSESFYPGIIFFDPLERAVLHCPQHGNFLEPTTKWCDGSDGAYNPRKVHGLHNNYVLVSKLYK